MNRRDIFASASASVQCCTRPKLRRFAVSSSRQRHPAAVVVEVVVHEVDVLGVHSRIPGVLVLGAIALVVLVEHVVVVDERIGRVGEEVHEELLDLGVEDPLDFGRVVEVLALRFEVRQRDAEPVHALGAVGREPRVVLSDAARVAQHLREVEALSLVALVVLPQRPYFGRTRRVPPHRVRRNDDVGRMLENGVAQRKRHAAVRRFDGPGPDMCQALFPGTKTETPTGLDGSGRRRLDSVDDGLDLAFRKLAQRRLDRRRGSRVSVRGRTPCRTDPRSRRWAAPAPA